MKRQPPRGRWTIAVLVDWLKDGYQNLVFAGISDAARDLGVNLLCFNGGVLGAGARFGTTRNFVYDHVGPHLVDGIVILAGTLANVLGPAALAEYCRRYQPLPMTSVAVPLPGLPTVVVDDADGVREAVRHLVDRHGHRRIGFIRGPSVNEEAERRFAAYRDVLAERGLPFDADLVAPGDFQAEAGAAAVRLFLDERKCEIDALVGANDHMVLGAMHELQRRGRRVPGDIACVGFDDVDEARFTSPPLTTVRQPLYRQGEQALRVMVERLQAGPEGGPPPTDRLRMKTDLIVRESCGCSSGRVELTDHHEALPEAEPRERFLAQPRTEVAAAMRRAVRSACSAAMPGWEDRLLDAFVADMEGSARGKFAQRLEEILMPVIAAGADVGAWHSVITTLRRSCIPALLNQPDRWLYAEDLFQAARVQIGDFAERAQARQKLYVDTWARTLSATSEALLATVSLKPLLRGVAEQLPRLGIPRGFLSLFANPQSPEGPRAAPEARLMLSFAPGGVAVAEGIPFPAAALLPADRWPTDDRFTFIVEPLTHERKQFGTLLLEMGPREGIIYESLREQIGSALNSASLVEQVVEEVTQRQRIESDRRKSVQDLFDNMQQAIFTVGPDGVIGQEVSAYARRVFGAVPIVGMRVADLLGLHTLPDQTAARRMTFWLACIFGADEMQWSFSVNDPLRALKYRRADEDGIEEDRFLVIEYAPIYQDGEVVKVMFIIKDITEVQRLETELARREAENRENLARVRQIVAMEPSLFATFIGEAGQILAQCESAAADLSDETRRRGAIHRLFRAMHTLKGNARIFGLAALQDAAHAAETHFQKVRDGEVPLATEGFGEVAAKIDQVRGLLGDFARLGRQVFGLGEPDQASGETLARIPLGRLQAVQRAMANLHAGGCEPTPAIAEALRALDRAVTHLTTPTLADTLAPVAKMAMDLAVDRSKRLEKVTLEGLDRFLPTEAMRMLRDLVVHAVRNAIDHGIESPVERVALGKPELGRVAIRLSSTAGDLVLTVEDDGRGVDRARVLDRAEAAGLIDRESMATLGDREVGELLFHPGLTTATATSEVSGRGVGLDAIRSLAHELGGEARMESTKGVGTCLRVRLPAMAEPVGWP